MRRMIAPLALAATLPALPAAALETEAGQVRLSPVVEGISDAWGIDFLPDGSLLFTRKQGELILLTPDGNMRQIEGLPEIDDDGQGGLLDVMVPRDFDETREIFLTFSRPQGWRGAGTALFSGTLAGDGAPLGNPRVLFEMEPGSSGGRHFGSRVVEGPDGHLFVTIGDRGDGPTAQDLGRENGSVVRLNRDGSVPDDNPFVDTEGAQPEIWSYGHRNPQGAAIDLSGQLWTVEHGARGGDEVNRIEKGTNYGWPVISYGTHYSGAPIGEGTAKDGMAQPVHFWDPSIAPSGMMVYSGKLWPEWEGDMFIGSLKFNYISRLEGDPLTEVEQISGDETLRVRDIAEAPDGAIWFISEGQGTIYRMTPE